MLKVTRTLLREARAMLLVSLLFALPSAVLLYYMSLHVDTALLERRIRQLRREQETLVKKNDALRKEIRRREFPSTARAERLPAPDRIVHIQIGPKRAPEGSR